MWAPFFIVWRESVEALLVIGILYAWIRRENIDAVGQLWAGTGFGLGLAAILAIVIRFAGEWYAGSGGEWFFTAMMVLAAFLILHMVVWMKRYGQIMKKHLEQQAASYITGGSRFGLMGLVMLAVAREGSETVIFLTGTIQQSSSKGLFIFGGLLGFLLAIATFALLQLFSHIIPWRWFYRLSAFVLLLLGGALIVGASDKIGGQIALYDNVPEWVFSVIYDPLWSTKWFFADPRGTLAGLTGYHAEPSLSQMLPLAFYWFCAAILLFWSKKTPIIKEMSMTS